MSYAYPIIAVVSAVVSLVTGFKAIDGSGSHEQAKADTGEFDALRTAPSIAASDHPTWPNAAHPEPHPVLVLPDHSTGPFDTVFTTRHAAIVSRNSGPMPKHASPVENTATTVATEHTATPTPTRSFETSTGAQPTYTPRHSATPPPATTTSPTPVVGGSAAVVNFALAQVGKPYIFGGTGPNGFDCSGLAMMAWKAAGVSIPRTSYDQWAQLPHVSTSSLEPGDILVFYGASHVGIYIGGGKMVDAPHTGAVIEVVSLAGYWDSVLIGAVRP